MMGFQEDQLRDLARQKIQKDHPELSPADVERYANDVVSGWSSGPNSALDKVGGAIAGGAAGAVAGGGAGAFLGASAGAGLAGGGGDPAAFAKANSDLGRLYASPGGAGGGAGPSGTNASMAQTDPDKYKLMQMHLAAMNQAAYRPEMADARMQGLRQQLGAYSGANNMLGKMYGQGAMMDLGAMGQNPMSQRMQQIGQPNQNGDIGLQPPPMGGPPPVGPGPGGSPQPFGWMSQPPPQGPPPPMGGAVRQAAGMIPGGGPPPPMGGPPPQGPPGMPPGGGMQPPPWTQAPPPIAPPPQPPTQRAPMAGMQRGPLTQDSILEALRALGRQ